MKRQATTEPQTHDYTRRYWGHDYTINRVEDGGQRLHMMGWGCGLRRDDYLLLPNGGNTTRYRIAAVKYGLSIAADNGDMWKAEVEFAPREILA